MDSVYWLILDCSSFVSFKKGGKFIQSVTIKKRKKKLTKKKQKLIIDQVKK